MEWLIMQNTITCTLCGHTFDPAQHPACESCPLHQGCSMACCPNCGASNINPAGSRLATWITRMLGGKHAQPAVLEK
jgi:rubredoxin